MLKLGKSMFYVAKAGFAIAPPTLRACPRLFDLKIVIFYKNYFKIVLISFYKKFLNIKKKLILIYLNIRIFNI